ncbi:MAG: hypothetical protein KAH23_10180, partial [Kiritimatiellae bacterium]|nr:hypothetical protein [Kiritimatiellia bacterium]
MKTILPLVLLGFFAAVPVARSNDFSSATQSLLREVNSYRFLNVGSIPGPDKYLSAMDGHVDGSPVEMWTWSDVDEQKWTVNEIEGGLYQIKTLEDDFYLRANAGEDGWSNGDLVELLSWNNWGSQKWNILYEGGYNVRFKAPYASGRYLNASGYNDGDPATIWQNSANQSQVWEMRMLENVQAPSIARAPNGNLVAYVMHRKLNGDNEGLIYSSSDDGVSWDLIKTLPWTIYAPSLFTHGSNLYLFYGSTGGNLILIKSSDSGVNWLSHILTHVGSIESGGGAAVTITDDFIYYGFMDSSGATTGSWPSHYKLVVASCPVGSDLTQGSNWILTAPKEFPLDPAVTGTREGWLEPSCLLGPDGRIWVIARVDDIDSGDVAAVLKLSADRTTLEFTNQYPAPGLETGFIDAPWAGSAKFHMVYDAVSERYLVMSNPYMGAPSENTRHPYVRNVMALYESQDLKNYSLVKTLLEDDFYEDWADSSWQTGFQQPSFIIDDSSLHYVSRTAYKGFYNYHDANKASYHELDGFRDYLSPDGEVAYYNFDDSADLGKDSSKMKNSSVDISGVGYASSGKYGGCALFDGMDDSLALMHRVSPKLDRANVISLSTWFRNDTQSSVDYIFSSAIYALSEGLEVVLIPSGIGVGG